MSPEQKRNPQKLTLASGIYALALVIYELLTGRLCRGAVHIPLAPKALQLTLSQALKRDPKERLQEVAPLIKALKQYLKGVDTRKNWRGTDYARWLVSEVHDSYAHSLDNFPDDWLRIDIGVAYRPSVQYDHTLVDCLRLPEGAYGILLARQLTDGHADPVTLSFLRGAFRSLAPLTEEPVKLIEMVHELLREDGQRREILLHYLVLSCHGDRLHYCTSGYGHIWHLHAGSDTPRKIGSTNPLIGQAHDKHFLSVQQRWSVGDLLVISTLETEKEADPGAINEEHFEKSLLRYALTSPQEIADVTLRQTFTNKLAAEGCNSAAVICIERTE